MVQLLLAAGAEVDAAELSRSTPLHWAADGDNLHVVKVLLDAGADPNMEDTNGHTGLHYADRRGCKEVVKLLLDAGAKSQHIKEKKEKYDENV